MKQNRNSRRVNQQAREKLAQIMLFEVADPDLALVTLTGVEVSVDKSVLHAYVSCEPERYETVQAALERAHGRVRSLLGRALGWRVTPELVWEMIRQPMMLSVLPVPCRCSAHHGRREGRRGLPPLIPG
jgi:ribosome-binding factor A